MKFFLHQSARNGLLWCKSTKKSDFWTKKIFKLSFYDIKPYFYGNQNVKKVNRVEVKCEFLHQFLEFFTGDFFVWIPAAAECQDLGKVAV